MALITDQSALFSFVHLTGYSQRLSNSQSIDDKSSLLSGMSRLPFILNGSCMATKPLTTGFNTYYKMEGYNPLTNSYENWHCMGVPLMNPPSGHSLTNISIVATWIDR